MVDHCYWGTGYYKDGCVTSGHLRRKQSILPTAATSPSCRQLQKNNNKKAKGNVMLYPTSEFD